VGPRTPISLITGALGSGKTTLLRQILHDAEQRLAVLMNEFGEIAIDSRILPGENLRIIELAGGCVCCELTGEFEAAVDEIIERFQPEQIVVEATGVADADTLAYEVQENLPQVRLDSVIHVVDAYASIEHPEVGYAARSQLRQADIILLNKIDLVTPAAVKAVEDQVRRYNDRALFLESIKCDVDRQVLFGLYARQRHIPQQQHAQQRLQSFVFATDRSLERKQFAELIESLPPEVYRAKGFVRFESVSYLFNYVAGRADFEEFPANQTQLVFIGPDLEAEQMVISDKLRKCEI